MHDDKEITKEEGGRHASGLIQVGPNRFKPYNEPTRALLSAHQEREKLSTTEIAKDLGYSVSTLSKYLNKKPEGDVLALEGLIEDYVANYKRRRATKAELFSTPVSQEVAEALDSAREEEDINLISGPAGLGKTCGCELYCADHPTATMITVVRSVRSSASGIVRALWDVGGTVNGRGKSYFETLVGKFKGTRRLIIVDNAHLLTKSGLGFLFDFNDETKNPIVLVGNPEIIDRIRKIDQQLSRIGIHWPLTVPSKEINSATRNLVGQFFPHADDTAAIMRLSTQVIHGHGHLRSLKKQLRLAQRLARSTGADPVKAFRAAHKMLIRDYDLND